MRRVDAPAFVALARSTERVAAGQVNGVAASRLGSTRRTRSTGPEARPARSRRAWPRHASSWAARDASVLGPVPDARRANRDNPYRVAACTRGTIWPPNRARRCHPSPASPDRRRSRLRGVLSKICSACKPVPAAIVAKSHSPNRRSRESRVTCSSSTISTTSRRLGLSPWSAAEGRAVISRAARTSWLGKKVWRETALAGCSPRAAPSAPLPDIKSTLACGQLAFTQRKKSSSPSSWPTSQIKSLTAKPCSMSSFLPATPSLASSTKKPALTSARSMDGDRRLVFDHANRVRAGRARRQALTAAARHGSHADRQIELETSFVFCPDDHLEFA